DLAGGEREYRRGIALFPQDRLMSCAFAEQLRTSGRCDAAVPIYRWLFVVLALLASANSITNGFVMDDAHLIASSERMHTLSGWWREFRHTYWPENWGGDGYRPLTIIAYRFEWALGAGKPVLFHAVNIGLHVAGSLAVLWLSLAILPVAGAFVAAALYA